MNCDIKWENVRYRMTILDTGGELVGRGKCGIEEGIILQRNVHMFLAQEPCTVLALYCTVCT
jgi:hypothetical protein